MTVTIKNAQFELIVNSRGAEIVSFKNLKTGRPIVWNGDSSVWGWNAPVCFPFCGKAKDGFFMIDGKNYEFENGHGFIREYEHALVQATETSLEWEIKADEALKARFPYAYSFKTRQELTAAGLIFTVTVTNLDSRPIYYSFGTHTSFWTALDESEKIADYCLEFEKEESFVNVYADGAGFKTRPLSADIFPEIKKAGAKNRLPLYESGWETGLILTGLKSDWVGLRSLKTGSLVRVSCQGFENVVIWQNVAGRRQFVCIEPWNGISDAPEADHVFEKKPCIVKLAAGRSVTYDQSIIIE